MSSPPDTATDAALLQAWCAQRDELAFSHLMTRHHGWVVATAGRLWPQERGRAQEVAQEVFIALAQKAARVRGGTLGGWLHRQTQFTVRSMQRAQRRRILREAVGGAALLDISSTPDPATPRAAEPSWAEVASLIDDGLSALPDKDRESVIRRFFQNQPLAIIARDAGITPGAAQKRIERALERLRGKLARRGLVTSSGLLSAMLLAAAPQKSPAAIVSRIATRAVKARVAGSPGFEPWVQAAALIVAATAAGGWAGYTVNAPNDSAAAPGTRSSIRAVDAPAAVDPLRARLTALEATGREGFAALRQHRLAESLRADSPESLAALFHFASEHTRDRDVPEALLRRWAQSDFPAAAVAYVDTDHLPASALGDALQQFAAAHPQEAARIFATLTDDDSLTLTSALLRGLGHSDPALGIATLRTAAARMKPETATSMLGAIYAEWAKRDPAAAAKSAIEGAPGFDVKGEPPRMAVIQTMRTWAASDPVAAAAFLHATPKTEGLRVAARHMLVEVASTSPQRLAEMFAALDVSDFPPAGRTSEMDDRNAFFTVGRFWAAKDPDAVRRHAEASDIPAVHTGLMEGLVVHLSSAAPAAARALAEAQPEIGLRTRLLKLALRIQE